MTTLPTKPPGAGRTVNITATSAEIVEHLAAVVDEVGAEFVYHDKYGQICEYTRNGEPACIVGRVFARLGIDVPALPNGPLGMLVVDEWVRFTEPGAYSVLGIAQQAQDTGHEYGNALKMAMTAHADGIEVSTSSIANDDGLKPTWQVATELAERLGLTPHDVTGRVQP